MRAFAQRLRTGRILVNAPTAVGALGGIYTAMPPTFSLGCGTWGGSTTTDNVNYRNLLNIKAVSRRQAPPQWFRVPSDTYFNAGSLDSLRTLLRADGGDRHRRAQRGARRGRRGPPPPRLRRRARDRRRRARARRGPGSAPAPSCCDRLRPDLVVAVGGGSVLDAAKAMRLFHEHPELSLRELALPFLDARKRVARYPQDAHRVRLVAVPTTSGTGSEVSPAAVVTATGARSRWSTTRWSPTWPSSTRAVPVDAAGADRRHRRRRAHPRAGGVRVDLRLAVHRRVLPAGDPPDSRRAAARGRRRERPRGAHRDGERRDDRRARVLERVPRGQPCARARRRRPLRRRARPRQRRLPPARAALQRRDPEQVHARARLRGLRRAAEVRADRLGPRARRTRRGRGARAAVRAHRRAARRRRDAALAA